MESQRTFSKEQISNILSKASKIQTRKDLYGEEQGLTEEELVHIAGEVGIDRESLLEAIQSADIPELDSNFKWFKSSSNIQGIQTVKGEITEAIWEDVVREIRQVTGGIGKINKVGKSFEWEQRIKEVGYKHITLTPQKGKTNIQFVSQWSALELILSVVPFFVGAGLAAVLLDGTNFPNFIYFIFPLFSGLGGVGMGRIYLKKYFENQKTQFSRIVTAIRKRIRPAEAPSIIIEDKTSSSKAASTKNKKAQRGRS